MNNKYLEDCMAAVKVMLHPDLSSGKILPEGKLEQFVDITLSARDEWRNNVNRDVLLRELKSEIDIGFSENYIRAHGAERDHVEWLNDEKRNINWKLWNRYKIYLQRKLSISKVNQINLETDDILGNLENPYREGSWYSKGLVVGRVQSGKTSNYIGLVNKAFDAGYKRIIVLSGLEKDLRVQTQIRFEEGTLGLINKKNTPVRKTGVGIFSNMDELKDVRCFTSRDDNGDIKRTDIDKWGHSLKSDDKLLLVCKKNVSVLESIILWLSRVSEGQDTNAAPYTFSDTIKRNFPEYKDGMPKPVISSYPILIIDDEADHASIDTKRHNWLQVTNVNDVLDDEYSTIEKPDPEHDPSRTNECIRRILNIFDKKAYVGYTATPFANIFISPERETAQEGKDLFPDDFVYSLPTADNYFGIEQLFSTNEPNEALQINCNFSNLVKIIDDHVDKEEDLENPRSRSGWMPPLQTSTSFTPKYQNKEEIPPSLENAILSFFIGSAVRKIRGQSDQHNSMMIHVTRFKDVQEKVKLQVENFVEKIKSAEFGNETHEILKRLKLIWESDFIHTINNELNPYKKEIPFNDILKNIFSEKGVIRQLEYVRLRGGVEDTLEYDNFKKVGKTVIVIGGQKLSRGLTLEGLSVSYFLRTAQLLLADTMTQMGRFFGYRKGYLDLCRLYITQPLNDVFHEFANSLTHLDSQFIEAAIGELTPKEYMYIVRESSQFRITSKSKSRDTVLQKLQFSGSLSQSIHLWQNEDNIVHNKKAVEKLLLSLGKNYTHGFEFEDEDKNSIVPNQRRILWKNIDSKNIIEFFKDYKTTPYARHNNSHCIREYIQLCNSEKGELMNWSVQLASGPRDVIEFNDKDLKSISPGCVYRANLKNVYPDNETYKSYKDVLPIALISEPNDELADLDDDEWEKTKLTHSQINADKESAGLKTSVKKFSGIAARHVRGKVTKQYRGLLTIYPVISGKSSNKTDSNSKTFGFCISFPKTDYGGKFVRVQRDWFRNQTGINV